MAPCYSLKSLSTSSSVPLACLSHLSWLSLRLCGIWHAIYMCVFVRVFAHAWDSKGNESSCHCWASMSRDARLAKGTVTCLSVSADLFQLQASLSFGYVTSSAHCLKATYHKLSNADRKTLFHSVANDQSACLWTPRVFFLILEKYEITHKFWLTAKTNMLLNEYSELLFIILNDE